VPANIAFPAKLPYSGGPSGSARRVGEKKGIFDRIRYDPNADEDFSDLFRGVGRQLEFGTYRYYKSRKTSFLTFFAFYFFIVFQIPLISKKKLQTLPSQWPEAYRLAIRTS
jgi:hypothetical protein